MSSFASSSEDEKKGIDLALSQQKLNGEEAVDSGLAQSTSMESLSRFQPEWMSNRRANSSSNLLSSMRPSPSLRRSTNGEYSEQGIGTTDSYSNYSSSPYSPARTYDSTKRSNSFRSPLNYTRKQLLDLFRPSPIPEELNFSFPTIASQASLIPVALLPVELQEEDANKYLAKSRFFSSGRGTMPMPGAPTLGRGRATSMGRGRGSGLGRGTRYEGAARPLWAQENDRFSAVRGGSRSLHSSVDDAMFQVRLSRMENGSYEDGSDPSQHPFFYGGGADGGGGAAPVRGGGAPRRRQNETVMWLYKDPQGEVQGPFSEQEMNEWHDAGYFTPSLLVKRVTQPHFVELGSILRDDGVSPFMTEVSPLETSPHFPPHQQPPFGMVEPNALLSGGVGSPFDGPESRFGGLTQKPQQLAQQQGLPPRDAAFAEEQLLNDKFGLGADTRSPPHSAVNTNNETAPPRGVGQPSSAWGQPLPLRSSGANIPTPQQPQQVPLPQQQQQQPQQPGNFPGMFNDPHGLTRKQGVFMLDESGFMQPTANPIVPGTQQQPPQQQHAHMNVHMGADQRPPMQHQQPPIPGTLPPWGYNGPHQRPPMFPPQHHHPMMGNSNEQQQQQPPYPTGGANPAMRETAYPQLWGNNFEPQSYVPMAQQVFDHHHPLGSLPNIQGLTLQQQQHNKNPSSTSPVESRPNNNNVEDDSQEDFWNIKNANNNTAHSHEISQEQQQPSSEPSNNNASPSTGITKQPSNGGQPAPWLAQANHNNTTNNNTTNNNKTLSLKEIQEQELRQLQQQQQQYAEQQQQQQQQKKGHSKQLSSEGGGWKTPGVTSEKQTSNGSMMSLREIQEQELREQQKRAQLEAEKRAASGQPLTDAPRWGASVIGGGSGGSMNTNGGSGSVWGSSAVVSPATPLKEILQQESTTKVETSKKTPSESSSSKPKKETIVPVVSAGGVGVWGSPAPAQKVKPSLRDIQASESAATTVPVTKGSAPSVASVVSPTKGGDSDSMFWDYEEKEQSVKSPQKPQPVRAVISDQDFPTLGVEAQQQQQSSAASKQQPEDLPQWCANQLKNLTLLKGNDVNTVVSGLLAQKSPADAKEYAKSKILASDAASKFLAEFIKRRTQQLTANKAAPVNPAVNSPTPVQQQQQQQQQAQAASKAAGKKKLKAQPVDPRFLGFSVTNTSRIMGEIESLDD